MSPGIPVGDGDRGCRSWDVLSESSRAAESYELGFEAPNDADFAVDKVVEQLDSDVLGFGAPKDADVSVDKVDEHLSLIHI